MDPYLAFIVDCRWMFLLCGFFSTYTGFVYNDFMSIMPNIFQSCYRRANISNVYVKDDPNCVYPFGFDWVWGESQNLIMFTNSYKMKFSIIIGVLHMVLGIILKGVNC